MLTTKMTALVGALLACVGASAQDFPARKPGLWEIVIESETRGTAMTTRMCIDPSVDRRMMERGHAMNGPGGRMQCSKRDIKATASGVTIDSVCTLGERTMTTHAETVFQGNGAYRTVIDSKTTPPIAGRGDSRVVQNAKWVSACPTDWKPGDMETPMGKFNVNAMIGDGSGARSAGKP
ncbi:MAG: DUF3617 family protein [Burkholderiales bacterium]|nr:DUF3617 family protein [Burkholderiales bacterium]